MSGTLSTQLRRERLGLGLHRPWSPNQRASAKRRLKELGEDLPRLWETPEVSVQVKKQILRTVLEEIVVLDADDPAEHRLQIHWMGGVHSEVRLCVTERGGIAGRLAKT